MNNCSLKIFHSKLLRRPFKLEIYCKVFTKKNYEKTPQKARQDVRLFQMRFSQVCQPNCQLAIETRKLQFAFYNWQVTHMDPSALLNDSKDFKG